MDQGDRQDRADARANQMDARGNEQDARAARGEGRMAEAEQQSAADLERVLASLSETVAVVESVERSVNKTRNDLNEERQADRKKQTVQRIVVGLALFAACLSSVAVFSICERANENRETIRIIIKAAYARSDQSLSSTPPSPEVQRRREEFQKVVDERTVPINCLNPLGYLTD